MFSSLGRFRGTPCPHRSCFRRNCLYSHAPDAIESSKLVIPVAPTTVTVPVKRTEPVPIAGPSTSPKKAPNEPPRKIQRTSVATGLPHSSSSAPSGVPTLKVSPAQSLVPIATRQTMLKTLFDHFVVLYDAILPLNPNIASEHAQRQEEEVYSSSTKTTYRNSIIQCVASLKRRPLPDKISHPSVGTDKDLKTRAKRKNILKEFRLSKDILEAYILTPEQLAEWGYVTVIPEGPGGDRPFHDGIATCERCKEKFLVRAHSPNPFECTYHWGRPQATRVGSERVRVFNCCSTPASEGGGCSQGRHVFYERDPKDLHARHSFSRLQPPDRTKEGSHLPVVTLDCEMIYTTGGMRVARISCVDGIGTTVFDEFIKMDEGVDIIDLNTRFSGITEENQQRAVLSLSAARHALNDIMNEETILVGHALNNDLNTLRIVHNRCVDTCIVFLHNGYRRALRDLVKQHLGVSIQTGDGNHGHSSVEDSVATLDLLRWHILNKQGRLPN